VLMQWIGIQDLMGFAAGAASIVAFSQKAMFRMRVAAVASNVFFIVYGALGALYPPLVLHSILLPLNLRELIKEVRSRNRP
jgi:CRP/FNR family cyclic AMP-dependent transcriptional regulator